MCSHFTLMLPALSSLLICMSGISISGERDTTTTKAPIEFAPALRSIQIDGTVFWTTAAYSGSVDLDLLQHAARRPLTLGIRAGAEGFETGGSGRTNGWFSIS